MILKSFFGVRIPQSRVGFSWETSRRRIDVSFYYTVFVCKFSKKIKHMYLFVRLFFRYAFDQVLAWELALRFSCILLSVKTAIHRGKLINGRPVA